MEFLTLIGIGVLNGLTTVLFGFGGGFVAVPVITWADAALGDDAARVAVATSALVMVANAGIATWATPRKILANLRGARLFVLLLGVGGIIGAYLTGLVDGAIIQWLFVAYLAVTIVDVLWRPGFVRPSRAAADEHGQDQFAIATPLGAPIGAVASFLGVGGSVMTVPLMRRGGMSMGTSTTLANPLTLAISLPSLVFFLAGHHVASESGSLVGAVDVRAAVALLIGAIPIIVWLRRRPPRIPDTVHAWTYIALLFVTAGAMIAAAI